MMMMIRMMMKMTKMAISQSIFKIGPSDFVQMMTMKMGMMLRVVDFTCY